MADARSRRDRRHVHDERWRDPAEVMTNWSGANIIDAGTLRSTTRGAFWDLLQSLRVTLLVTREYEHLSVALGHVGGRRTISFMPVPHPSGLAVDRARGSVYIASTRNPNQVIRLEPVIGLLKRRDMARVDVDDRPLIPVATRFHPGSSYLHDIAFIGDHLHGNAVASNAIVRLSSDAPPEPVWWPRCVETRRGPALDLNYIQLNSIAAGPSLEESFFSASAARIATRRPGHRRFRVDKQGVVFSGKTREPIVTGLTRPHSARIHDGRVWVDNSGYGEVGFVSGGSFVPAARLPGWTRGLCFVGNVAFVATSRVLPRFARYAPGLSIDTSLCGVHAIDVTSGRVLGSLTWPEGNQVFAVEAVPASLTSGFLCRMTGARRTGHPTLREKTIAYAFRTRDVQQTARSSEK